MQEIEFRNWLSQGNNKKKVQQDTISRLKKIEKEFEQCDLDEHYKQDRCEFLMGAFLNMGYNSNMKKYPDAKFPTGKYYLSTYRNALKQYVSFCDSVNPSVN